MDTKENDGPDDWGRERAGRSFPDNQRSFQLHPDPPGSERSHNRDGSAVLRRFFLLVMLLLAAGLLGYWLAPSSHMQRPHGSDVLFISAENWENVRIEFETSNSGQASRYMRDMFGRRVTTPEIEGAVLTGVGTVDVGPDAQVPAFVYREPSEEPIVVFAYNYAFLDRHRESLQLEEAIYHSIVDEDYRVVRDLGERKLVVWRQDDDIFIAVTGSNAEQLGRRIFTY